MSNENNNLSLYGWSDNLFRQKQISQFKDMSHGRIIVTHKTCYEVVAEDGVYLCELTGNMIYGRMPDEYPCTGDWVIFQPFDANKGIIVDTLPRERALYRKKNGTVADRQAIASYVDKAFIVQSLDDNFNVRRAERFIAQIMEENIKPVLVLNKKRRNGRVCRLFGCRQEFTGEYPLREIGTEYFRYKPVYREGTAYFDSSGNGIGGWLRCFNRHSGCSGIWFGD